MVNAATMTLTRLHCPLSDQQHAKKNGFFSAPICKETGNGKGEEGRGCEDRGTQKGGVRMQELHTKGSSHCPSKQCTRREDEDEKKKPRQRKDMVEWKTPLIFQPYKSETSEKNRPKRILNTHTNTSPRTKPASEDEISL
jgi:hypothetical protein